MLPVIFSQISFEVKIRKSSCTGLHLLATVIRPGTVYNGLRLLLYERRHILSSLQKLEPRCLKSRPPQRNTQFVKARDKNYEAQSEMREQHWRQTV